MTKNRPFLHSLAIFGILEKIVKREENIKVTQCSCINLTKLLNGYSNRH
jgi:hypothetical protein